MAAKTFPSNPSWANPTEQAVWERLVEQAPDSWTVIANLVLSPSPHRPGRAQRRATDREYEVDLLVLMPELGVVVLEVKGGSVFVDDRGRWRQGVGLREHGIDPVHQAMDGKYEAREYVERDPRWARPRVRWTHAVVFPDTVVSPDFSMPDCPRERVHDRGDMPDLAGRLATLARTTDCDLPVPTVDDCDEIVRILHGRNLPLRDVVAAAAAREDAIERLTIEQMMILRATRLIPRMEIRGGAGSGKTVLALAQAKDLTRGADDRPAQRVALLCYSLGLASMFTRRLSGEKRQHRPAFVGSFEEFARYLGVERFGGREDADFWETELPQRMSELAAQLPEGKKFDAFVVDEGQDFADSWWTPILRSLRDEDNGGLYVYSDENQRVFPRFGRPPVQLVPLVLDHNLRNTKQIADAFSPLTPMRMHARGGDGPDVHFVPAEPARAIGVADEAVEILLEEGWDPEHVALITTGKRHPVQAERQENDGQDGYWASFWDGDDVFYGHVLGCKGLERKAVVLCINDTNPERAKERLYVGLSRATDRLIVVGDPAYIRNVGGDAVARKLGIPV